MDSLLLTGSILPVICLISIILGTVGRKFSNKVIISSGIPTILFLITNLVALLLPDATPVWSKIPFVVVILVMCIAYTVAIHVNILRKKENSVSDASRTMIIWATFILAWEIASAKLLLVSPIYFPPPSKVAGSFFTDKATYKLFILSTQLSAKLLYSGYAMGVTSGVLTGLLIGWSQHVEKLAVPIVKVVSPIPATAWIPIAIVTFPNLEHASLFVLWIAAFFPALFNTYAGVKSLPKHHVEMARVLGAKDLMILRRVVIPYAMPAIFVGIYFALVLDLISLIPAEMVGVQAGIGWFMSYARSWSRYDLVYANVIEIGLISIGTLEVVDRIQSRVLRWQKGVVR